MKIKDKKVKEILITDSDNGLIASITDNNVITYKNYKVRTIAED